MTAVKTGPGIVIAWHCDAGTPGGRLDTAICGFSTFAVFAVSRSFTVVVATGLLDPGWSSISPSAKTTSAIHGTGSLESGAPPPGRVARAPGSDGFPRATHRSCGAENTLSPARRDGAWCGVRAGPGI